MKDALKRYSIALFILFAVVGLMILGTMGVKSFSDKMVKDANIVENIKPRGENLIK
ncbi:MAG: hypothetical protein OQK48_02655 [Sulfurimonas sp.]|uniref:hypothetical protein n=1 Tax=Sulfurimonas sp. TaxID=2022749 RepID=UPI002632F3F3|nr:hypothetical protein [Sulfurimonas sp.]MCW8895440.1 hypothetical protein [Sulfurimonas sp.]MCW8953824.1 hypothetical protein [Sulfurimonas sp.]MCW9067405.1 hypothetical protein [Sulfurimonas sp.]